MKISVDINSSRDLPYQQRRSAERYDSRGCPTLSPGTASYKHLGRHVLVDQDLSRLKISLNLARFCPSIAPTFYFNLKTKIRKVWV
jgi:hypothetical protein